MTAWVVHRFADLVGLPGWAVIELALACQSRPILELGLVLKRPAWELRFLALHLADN